MKSNGKVVFALLAGAAAGAALGLLLAPGKGSESRKNITEAAKKLVDSLGLTERFSSESNGSSSNGRTGASNSSRSEGTTASASQASEAGRSRTGQTA